MEPLRRISYVALGQGGRKVRGALRAVSVDEVRVRLLERGDHLLRTGSVRARVWGGRVTPRDVAELSLHLGEMLKAGVPLLEALTHVAEGFDQPLMRDALYDVQHAVRGGAAFSQALQQHPEIFDPIFCGLVAMGEAHGDLGSAFDRLSILLETQENLRQKTMRALWYPCLLLGVMGLLIAVMTLVVLPQLTDFLENMGGALPLSSRVLMGVARFAPPVFFSLLCAGALGSLALWGFARVSSRGAAFLERVLSGIPVLGALRRDGDLARFFRVFHALVAADLEMLVAFDKAQAVLRSQALRAACDTVLKRVRGGETFASALRATIPLPPLVVRLLKTGEETGALPPTLGFIANFYERHHARASDRLIALIEPTFIAVTGLVLLWVAMAVFFPIYDQLSGFDR